MRIDLRDVDGRRLGRVEVDPARRPNLVRATPPDGGEPREQFLNWDGAIDDAGRLRKCLCCGCGSLYRAKALPQVTPFVVVLAFAGAAVGLLGYAADPRGLAALVVLLVLDIATLVFARPRLVCYRCGTVYARHRIARYFRPWERSEAERIARREDLEAAATPVTPAEPVSGNR
jgi:hypothetical protein